MYGLTKKQLSIFKTISQPIRGYNGRILSRPVVLSVSCTGVYRAYTLSFFKYLWKLGDIDTSFYEYYIVAVL